MKNVYFFVDGKFLGLVANFRLIKEGLMQHCFFAVEKTTLKEFMLYEVYFFHCKITILSLEYR